MSGNLMAILYLSVPLSIAGSFQRSQVLHLLMVLSVVWAGDTFAYWVGKRWGKHKVTSQVSPHKSLEGYLAGLLFSVLAAMVFGHYFFPVWPTAYLVLIGVFLGLVGTVGDRSAVGALSSGVPPPQALKTISQGRRRFSVVCMVGA